MSAKVKAACETASFGIKVVVASGVLTPDVLLRAADNEAIGTVFNPVGSKQGSKGWMRNNLRRGRKITLDDGAVDAIREHNRSLLPAGIREVQGTFDRGDVVYIANLNDEQVGYGMTNYGYHDLQRIKGERTDRIREILGHHYGDEAVHRSNMVILRNGSDH
jgi:glutamate 5-kinase